ncbi:hypothetical protein ACOSQ3_028384 [Xanthoceras sorbifolium]
MAKPTIKFWFDVGRLVERHGRRKLYGIVLVTGCALALHLSYEYIWRITFAITELVIAMLCTNTIAAIIVTSKMIVKAYGMQPP